jgi:hypothetical protein
MFHEELNQENGSSQDVDNSAYASVVRDSFAQGINGAKCIREPDLKTSLPDLTVIGEDAVKRIREALLGSLNNTAHDGGGDSVNHGLLIQLPAEGRPPEIKPEPKPVLGDILTNADSSYPRAGREVNQSEDEGTQLDAVCKATPEVDEAQRNAKTTPQEQKARLDDVEKSVLRLLVGASVDAAQVVLKEGAAVDTKEALKRATELGSDVIDSRKQAIIQAVQLLADMEAKGMKIYLKNTAEGFRIVLTGAKETSAMSFSAAMGLAEMQMKAVIGTVQAKEKIEQGVANGLKDAGKDAIDAAKKVWNNPADFVDITTEAGRKGLYDFRRGLTEGFQAALMDVAPIVGDVIDSGASLFGLALRKLLEKRKANPKK